MAQTHPPAPQKSSLEGRVPIVPVGSCRKSPGTRWGCGSCRGRYDRTVVRLAEGILGKPPRTLPKPAKRRAPEAESFANASHDRGWDCAMSRRFGEHVIPPRTALCRSLGRRYTGRPWLARPTVTASFSVYWWPAALPGCWPHSTERTAPSSRQLDIRIHGCDNRNIRRGSWRVSS